MGGWQEYGEGRKSTFLPCGDPVRHSSLGWPWLLGSSLQPPASSLTHTLLFLRIIFSTPLAVISYFLIWFVPDFPHGQTYWYLLFYCLFETMVTVSVGTSSGCLWGPGGGWYSGPPGLAPEATPVCPPA